MDAGQSLSSKTRRVHSRSGGLLVIKSHSEKSQSESPTAAEGKGNGNSNGNSNSNSAVTDRMTNQNRQNFSYKD